MPVNEHIYLFIFKIILILLKKSDIKLYCEDAIMSICGVKAIYCTPSKMMEYLGLVVPEKPFDIYAIITNLTEYNTDLEFDLNGSIQNKNYLIKPANPKYHRCNETYKYGDLDYGAKCGCKVRFFVNFLVFLIL